MPTTFSPVIADTSHYDVIQTDGFGKLARAGYKGLINKATQGSGIVDITYGSRRTGSVDDGLYYGGYHFGDDSDPVVQCDHFLGTLKADASILIALDWEDNKNHTMSCAQARAFLDRLMEKTGRKPSEIYIYGSYAFLNDIIKTAADLAYFGQFNLWLACYSARTRIPKAWRSYKILQYTGDGQGPSPHDAPGITIAGGVDNNVVCDGFDFDRDWGAKPVVMASASKPLGIADLVPVSRKAALTVASKRVLQGTTGASLLSAVGMSKDTYNQVSAMVASHWLAIAVTACILGIIVFKVFESYMVDDVNSGRATPSGAT